MYTLGLEELHAACCEAFAVLPGRVLCCALQLEQSRQNFQQLAPLERAGDVCEMVAGLAQELAEWLECASFCWALNDRGQQRARALWQLGRWLDRRRCAAVAVKIGEAGGIPKGPQLVERRRHGIGRQSTAVESQRCRRGTNSGGRLHYP